MNMDEDPLIAALERRVRSAENEERKKATRETTTDIYAARLRWWRIKSEGYVFFFTHEPVAFTRSISHTPNGDEPEYVGYASGVMKVSSGFQEIIKESVGIHRTRREAKQRAYDTCQGYKLACALKNKWSVWNEPKRKED